MAPMVSGTKNDEIELKISDEKLKKNKDNLIKLRITLKIILSM